METIVFHPHLQFAVQAWSPYWQRDIYMIKRVQERVTKIISERRHESYEAWLRALLIVSNLATLNARTEGQLIQLFKIHTGAEASRLHLAFRYQEFF